jgi:hypothetical protein
MRRNYKNVSVRKNRYGMGNCDIDWLLFADDYCSQQKEEKHRCNFCTELIAWLVAYRLGDCSDLVVN